MTIQISPGRPASPTRRRYSPRPRRQAAGRRPDADRSDEAAPRRAVGPRRPRRHQGPARHQGRRRHRDHRRDDPARGCGRIRTGDAAIPALASLAGTSATGRCAPWAPSAVPSPTTIRRPTTRRRCWDWARLCHHAAQDRGRRLLPGHVHHGAEDGEIITAISFPGAEARGLRQVQETASRFAIVGVFVAEFGDGVRVAVTGAGQRRVPSPGMEKALTTSFTPESRQAGDAKIERADPQRAICTRRRRYRATPDRRS